MSFTSAGKGMPPFPGRSNFPTPPQLPPHASSRPPFPVDRGGPIGGSVHSSSSGRDHASTTMSGMGTAAPSQNQPTEQESEMIAEAARARADAAENRLLRAMAKFSKVTPMANTIAANRAGSATVASVESRNEVDAAALWEDFPMSSPVQFLKAELKTPTQTALLERQVSRFEVVVPLHKGSLNMILLPDLTISKVQREDLDCQEGDRIVEVEGTSVYNIEDLRGFLIGKDEITLVIATGGTPLFTIHDSSTPYWEVTSVPAATTVRGALKPGDLVLRINDEPVEGLDTRKALDTNSAKVSLLPSGSLLAQRIKTEGLMSYTTQVEVNLSKDFQAEPRYNIILTNFEPAMFAGVYIVGVFLGRHQIGQDFNLEITEGPADARRSDVARDGLWQATAGVPLEFELLCHDSAGNKKAKGGDTITVVDAKVSDLKNGTYKVVWAHTAVGNRAIEMNVNGEIKQGTPQVEVVPAEAAPSKCQVAMLNSVLGVNCAAAAQLKTWTVTAGTSVALQVRLFDQYGNPRPRGKDKVTVVQRAACFHQSPIGTEMVLTAAGLGLYEFKGLVSAASPKGPKDELALTEVVVLNNGRELPDQKWRMDVVPTDVALDKCHAVVPAAGIVARAGEDFAFNVVVRDAWENARNRGDDSIELFEFNFATMQRGEPLGVFKVSHAGHGTYRVEGQQTVARQTRFVFAVNGSAATAQHQIYTLQIVPNDISVEHCTVSGDARAAVGQYVALLISLRDRFGNVCSRQQQQESEISVRGVKKLAGFVAEEDLALTTRISSIEFHAGRVYTHQVVLSAEQAVEAAFDLFLAQSLIKRVSIAFQPEALDPKACTVTGLPLSTVAGETMETQITLADAYKNGLEGLLESVTMAYQDTASREGAVQAEVVSREEVGEGRYKFAFRIVKASPALLVTVSSGAVGIAAATLTVLPSKARAACCEADAASEVRVHFPFQLGILLRDQFHNLAVAGDAVVTASAEGCNLAPGDCRVLLEAGPTLLVVFTPRWSGDVALTVTVNEEKVVDRTVRVGTLEEWTKESCAQWVRALAWVDAPLREVARKLGDEFVSQNVTGAKVQGGLLDTGALHFAFKIEELETAKRLAEVFKELSNVPVTAQHLRPWTWTSDGQQPEPLVAVTPEEDGYGMAVERLAAMVSRGQVRGVERNENLPLLLRYAAHRQELTLLRGDPSERLLWFCAPPGADEKRLLSEGFVATALQPAPHMVLGVGHYFAADPSVAHWMGGPGSAGDERSLVLCRVCCGETAQRPPLSATGPDLIPEARRPVHSLPPAGFNSVTSPARTEAVTFHDHTAYPELVVRYACPFRVDVSWPATGSGSSLLKLDLL